MLQGHPNSWPEGFLLVPKTAELLPSEIDELTAHLRKGLGLEDKKPSLSTVRTKLRAHRGLTALPLLYAMRYIARQWGARQRFWPELRSRLFNNLLKDAEVESLAPYFTKLWESLAEYSQHRIYVPRFGPAHIKWPLAHAGILQSDVLVITRFGIDLWADANRSDLNAPPDLSVDPDDFALTLLGWLEDRGRRGSGLAKQLATQDPAAMLTADLIQRWLVDHAEELAVAAKSNTRAGRPLGRVRLDYDLGSDTIGFRLASFDWPERVSFGHLVVNEQSVGLTLSYQPQTGTTHVDGVFVPAQHSRWTGNAELHLGGIKVAAIPLPKSPFPAKTPAMPSALPFNALSGRRTHRWNPGDAYIIVGDSKLAREPWFSLLFDSSPPHSLAGTGWDDFRVWHTFAKDPLDVSESEVDAHSLSEYLQDATRILGLTVIQDWQGPHVRAVDGALVDYKGDSPRYAVRSPPLFELRGLWHSSVEVRLEAFDSTDSLWRTTGRIWVPTQARSRGCIISLFDIHPAKVGLYRVIVGDVCQWTGNMIEPPQRHSVPGQITINLTDEAGACFRDATRFPLEILTGAKVTISAWPGAPVDLNVDVDGVMTWSSLQTDEKGRLELTGTEIRRQNRQAKVITLRAEVGPITSRTLEFATGPYLRNFGTKPAAGEMLVTGEVLNLGLSTAVRFTVTGPRPWAGDPCFRTATLDATGRFATQVTKPPQGGWLFVTPNVTIPPEQDSTPLLHVEKLSGAVSSRSRTTSLAQSRKVAQLWQRWLTVHPIPPGLSRVLYLSKVSEFVKENVSPLMRASHLVPLTVDSTDVLADIARDLLAPEILLLPHNLPPVKIEDRCMDPTKLPDLVPGTILHSTWREQMWSWVASNANSADGMIQIEYKQFTARHRARMSSSEGEQSWHLISTLDFGLALCEDCWKIMPTQAAWHSHAPGFGQKTRCSRLRVLSRGESLPVRPFVLLSPWRLLAALSTLVEEIVRDQLDFEVTPYTATRIESLAKTMTTELGNRSVLEWISEVRSVGTQLLDFRRSGSTVGKSGVENLAQTITNSHASLAAMFQWVHTIISNCQE